MTRHQWQDKQAEQQRALDQLDRLMRERGGLPSVPESIPLHKMALARSVAVTAKPSD
jgi:hypothetical protein